MATRKKKAATTARAKKVAEEAQTVGADIVPSVTIEVDLRADSNSLLSDWDYHLFNEGSHTRLWEKLGSHVVTRDGVNGTMFAVWAPNAAFVSVMGDCNGWNPEQHPLELRGA